MKILLTTLNSKYVHSNLSLKYLYAVAAEWQSSIELKEFTINHEDDYIYTELVRGDYDVVCFSCYIWNIHQIQSLAENLKKAKPKVKIALGGPEVSFETQSVFRNNPYVDFVMIGEGEGVFCGFVEQLMSERPNFKKVRGLAWQEKGMVNMNPPAKPLVFESVPFPYTFLPAEEDKVLYYESSRGCPFRCAYCLSSIDKNIRALPMERVRQDLSYFIYKKVKQVKFVDRTFNYDKERCKDIFSYLIEHDNGITNFHFEMCGDLVDDEMIALLKTARDGLFQFEIGIQSTHAETLAACNRPNNFEKVADNVLKIREARNIHLHLDLIAGLPYEDYITFRNSFNDAYALKADALQLGFLKILKGSPMIDRIKKYHYVYKKNAPYEVISNEFISSEGLSRLKMVEHVLDLYYNRGGFSGALEYATATFYESAFDFYQQFANFYYLKGYQGKSHKKEDLYRIFDKFGIWRNKEQPGIYESLHRLLVEDMGHTLNPDAIKKFEKKGWALK